MLSSIAHFVPDFCDMFSFRCNVNTQVYMSVDMTKTVFSKHCNCLKITGMVDGWKTRGAID